MAAPGHTHEPDSEPEPAPAQTSAVSEVALPRGGAAPTPRGVLGLQRAAGNQAVARWLQSRPVVAREGATAAPATPAAPPGGGAAPAVPAREDHVFLMGDPAADEFYREARGYYGQKYPKATIREVGSLADMLAAVTAAKAPIGHLVIVSHANEDGTLSFKLDANDPNNKLDYGELKKANEGGNQPQVDVKIVDEQTSIEIRGCNIGRSPLMLDQIDEAFGGKAKVTAPTHEQHYSHDTAGQYTEDFSGYFVEAPANLTKSDQQLQPLFAAKYPFVEAKQWPALIKKKTVFHDKQGPYSKDVLMPDDKDALKVFGPTLAAQPDLAGWKLRFVKKVGDDYEFEASRLNEGAPEKKPVQIKAGAPTKAELEAEARADLSRPEAYDYPALKSTYDGKGTRTFTLEPERTEWRIRHTVIKDDQGPYQPPAGDKGYWGESSYTP